MGEFFKCRFPDWLLEAGFNINVLEFLVVIVAVRAWKHKLRHKRIQVHCDNLVSSITI